MHSILAMAFTGLLQGWLAPNASPTILKSVPELGDPMPCHPDPSEITIIASAQTASGCEVVVDGITFFVATIERGDVAYISVDDSHFVTKEGVRVGTPVGDVVKLGGKFWKERGWGFHARLPSGWEAAVAQGSTMTDGELSEQASVQWLFRRK